MTDDKRDGDENLHFIADVDDVPERGPLLVEVEGVEMGIYEIDGAFYAVANYCIHQGGPLCEGQVSGTLDVDDSYELVYTREDEIVSCPWHGWEFDIKTGNHLARDEFQIPTYDVCRQNGSLYVNL